MKKQVNKNNTNNRSKLSTASFIKWIRSHFHNQNRKNYSYLHFPQDLIRQKSIEQIFIQFDADGSGGLSRDQIFDMFNSFNIPITMENLNDLYDSVETNLEELNCDMFKRCALSEQSNQVFRRIIKELEFKSVYLPHNFTSMIVYLVYLSKRQELYKKLKQTNNNNNNNNSINSKVNFVTNLLQLKDLSLNNQRLNTHAQGFKTSLRYKFRDVWEKVNENYKQRYPCTMKLEQQFYQYYLNQQNKSEGKNNQSKQICKIQ